MIMTKAYFEANCVYVMEFENEDYRYRKVGTLEELREFKKHNEEFGYYVSDFDFCANQTDTTIRHFLNVVEYNWKHNKEMLDRLHITSLYALVERALNNWDYK